jgi:hypothetical protein
MKAEFDVETMSTLPPVSVSDDWSDVSSEINCPLGPRWADFEFEEEDTIDCSAYSVSSEVPFPSLEKRCSEPASPTSETVNQNAALPMLPWQWVPVTMVPVAMPASPAAACFHSAQNGCGMLDISQALEARKAAMGHVVHELAVASRKVEKEAGKTKRVGKALPAQSRGSGGPERTTIMIRNIPSGCTRAMVQAAIDREGFAGRYDFLYLPFSFDDWSTLGHAFINFADHCNAQRAIDRMQGGVFWPELSSEQSEVCWSKALLGLAACIGKFRNSPVMDPCVSDEYKPIVLKNGVRSSFPEPTKEIQPVRRRE